MHLKYTGILEYLRPEDVGTEKVVNCFLQETKAGRWLLQPVTVQTDVRRVMGSLVACSGCRWLAVLNYRAAPLLGRKATL